MGDVGGSGPDPLKEIKAFLKREMRMVVTYFHAIDGDGIEAFEFLEFFVLYQVHIREICDVAEPVTKDGDLLFLEVPALYGNDFH